jgi:hypothetical protein
MLCLIDSIRHGAPAGQRWLRAVEDAHTLTALLLAAWSFARVMTVHSVEEVVAERACRATAWPRCPACGGLAAEEGLCQAPGHESVWASPVAAPRWTVSPGMRPRAGGALRCGARGAAPSADQRCAPVPGRGAAVLVPCATVARWRGWESGGSVSPRAVWCGAQAAGQRAMERLQAHVPAVATGDVPP